MTGYHLLVLDLKLQRVLTMMLQLTVYFHLRQRTSDKRTAEKNQPNGAQEAAWQMSEDQCLQMQASYDKPMPSLPGMKRSTCSHCSVSPLAASEINGCRLTTRVM
mmetsp:Transcript_10884/g.21133  ORF Transcript_10884/g.21133 Transcript_10884/m.21133 type:complete len:105 (-) Transcript_10884:557-871(-)